MRRREFIAGLGAAAWPLAACAQQGDRVRAQLQILRLQAEGAAEKIGHFIKEIENQMGWTTQLTWSASTIEQRRFDGLRLLKQVPAITELAQLDPTGKEQLRVSRLKQEPPEHNDYSHDPKFTEAVAKKVYYGPVYFRRESEPYMTLSLAGTRSDAGVSVAEVDLSPVWEVIWLIKVGEHGVTYVLDAQDRVIAHSDMYASTFDAQGRGFFHFDISLFQRDFSNLAQVQASRGASVTAVRLGFSIRCPVTDSTPEPERRVPCFTSVDGVTTRSVQNRTLRANKTTQPEKLPHWLFGVPDNPSLAALNQTFLKPLAFEPYSERGL